jgi:hypothetical protein
VGSDRSGAVEGLPEHNFVFTPQFMQLLENFRQRLSQGRVRG